MLKHSFTKPNVRLVVGVYNQCYWIFSHVHGLLCFLLLTLWLYKLWSLFFWMVMSFRVCCLKRTSLEIKENGTQSEKCLYFIFIHQNIFSLSSISVGTTEVNLFKIIWLLLATLEISWGFFVLCSSFTVICLRVNFF